MGEGKEPRRIGRSIGAVLAGALAGIVLSMATDMIMQAVGIFPPLGKPMPDHLLVIAMLYRTVYNVAGAYLTALIAPNRPMGHALVLGALGFAACVAGSVIMGNKAAMEGHEWYGIVLIVLAVPSAWAGGKLRVLQQRHA